MRRAWIVLFLIALLPVRGWAVAAMTADAGVPHGTHGASVAVAPPCHGDMAAVGHDAADHVGTDHGPAAAPDGPDTSVTAHLCAVCDLCHAPAAPAATGPTLGLHAPTPVRCAIVQRDTGRVLADSLERPPRA